MALVGQICAGIDVAKAQRLLTFFIDETELDCSSLQSMVLTIKDEGGLVRNVTLDGVTLLTMKTAEAATSLPPSHVLQRWRDRVAACDGYIGL